MLPNIKNVIMGIFFAYGVPIERTVINSHTTCIKMNYYLRNLRIE